MRPDIRRRPPILGTDGDALLKGWGGNLACDEMIAAADLLPPSDRARVLAHREAMCALCVSLDVSDSQSRALPPVRPAPSAALPGGRGNRPFLPAIWRKTVAIGFSGTADNCLPLRQPASQYSYGGLPDGPDVLSGGFHEPDHASFPASGHGNFTGNACLPPLILVDAATGGPIGPFSGAARMVYMKAEPPSLAAGWSENPPAAPVLLWQEKVLLWALAAIFLVSASMMASLVFRMQP